MSHYTKPNPDTLTEAEGNLGGALSDGPQAVELAAVAVGLGGVVAAGVVGLAVLSLVVGPLGPEGRVVGRGPAGVRRVAQVLAERRPRPPVVAVAALLGR